MLGLSFYDRPMCYNKDMKTEKKVSRKSMPLRGLERVYIIDREIASGRYPNTNELVQCIKRASDECECTDYASVATVSRDIEFMKDRYRAPIEYDASENCEH